MEARHRQRVAAAFSCLRGALRMNMVRPMSTLTIELPDTLKHRLDEEARRCRISPARLIRRTLEASLSNGKEHAGSSLYELTRDLCGSVSGGPRDLARNKRHLKGYGAWKR